MDLCCWVAFLLSGSFGCILQLTSGPGSVFLLFLHISGPDSLLAAFEAVHGFCYQHESLFAMFRS